MSIIKSAVISMIFLVTPNSAQATINSTNYEDTVAAFWMYTGAARACDYKTLSISMRRLLDDLMLYGKRKGLETILTKSWDLIGIDNLIGMLEKEQRTAPKMSCTDVKLYCEKMIRASKTLGLER